MTADASGDIRARRQRRATNARRQGDATDDRAEIRRLAARPRNEEQRGAAGQQGARARISGSHVNTYRRVEPFARGGWGARCGAKRAVLRSSERGDARSPAALLAGRSAAKWRQRVRVMVSSAPNSIVRSLSLAAHFISVATLS